MGGASFPTHIKLTPPKPVEDLIINGAECEPYLTGDYRLMIEKTKEIIQGMALVKRCTGAKNVFIGIEDNKPEAIKKFTVSAGSQYTVKVLKSLYPQGGEKQLIKSVLGKEVPAGKLPFDAGACVQNVGTVLAIYEAVYYGKPLYERVVTVTGSCVSNPKNLLVRIGIPIKELITYCGPLAQEPAKIIIGGPMMGIAQYTDEVPVIKSTTEIILMNKKEAEDREESFCIRCGACVRECPARLMPTLINLASQKEMWQAAKFYGASDCIECGVCAYVCPSNIRLVQSIKRAKLELMK
jgi:electron transport complex protein RnfC